MAKELKIADLNKLYTEAEECDREVFAEQRSNILLIAGEHYNKKANRLYSRLRDNRDLSETQRLRLTKNHMHKVYRHYTANILAYAPGVTILPKNEAELQDQKDAELNLAVWQDAKDRYRLHEQEREEAQAYVGIGEVASKIFFDPSAGELRGYDQKVQMDDLGNPKMDEMSGQPQLELDEMGQPQEDKTKPIFKGAFVFEPIFGFNLLRAPGAKTMKESPYLINRKMVDSDELKAKFKGDDKKTKMITATKNDTYVVFDSTKGEYQKSREQTLVKEYYWKPCYQYPMGYWAIATTEGILDEGELPFGIYPIIWAGFDEYPTHPRARSILKQVRPYQAEINRAASAMATHQVTIGDDKVIYQQGTKLAPGALLPGVRGITFQGTPPTILPGRDGSQYLEYIDAQIKELYMVAEMDEEQQASPAQVDAYAMLYSSLRQQRKYAIYGEKFEQYLIDKCRLYLDLARHYLSDDEIIYAIGKSEQINIAEFKATTQLCYEIKIEPMNETLESQMGKQLSISHALQYIGPQLQRDDIGRLMQNLPFGNMKESFEDLTIDYDMAKNDFLAIERGEKPEVNEYDKHDYLVQKVVSRMKKADWKFLPPQIKVAYINYKSQHEKFMSMQAQALIDAKNEFIPVGGAMIACDMYVPNPDDPKKEAKRVRIPYQSMDWLVHKLEAQNMPLQKLEKMNGGEVSDLTSMIPKTGNQQQQAPSPAQGMPMPPSGGQASPIGVS
jgi:hypothetical protein